MYGSACRESVEGSALSPWTSAIRLFDWLAGDRSSRQRTLFLIAASIPIFAVSNPVWQSLHAIAWILLTIEMVRDRRWLIRAPRRWAIPWTLFLCWSLLAAFLSPAWTETIYDSKKLANSLAIFLFLTVFRTAQDYLRVLAVTAVLLSAEAIMGIFQFAMAVDPLDARAHGTLSHHMTFTGMLLIMACFTLPHLSLRPRGLGWLWWSFVILALLAIVASLTRSAWLALIPALVVVLGYRRPRWLLALPVLFIALFLALPQVRSRTLSIFDTRGDYSNVHRLSMYPTGFRMVAEHPWFGFGSKDQVKKHYREFEIDPPTPPQMEPGGPPPDPYQLPLHLHSNLMEIAAEKGLPALAAWLAALVVYFREVFRHLGLRPFRQTKISLERAMVLGSLAAALAFLGMGMLEYNYGDSEVSILFVMVLSVPFVLRPVTETP